MVREESGTSIRRLALVFEKSTSTVGAWVRKGVAGTQGSGKAHCRPVSGDPGLRDKVRSLCEEPRHRTFGYRRIWALLRRMQGIEVNRKTVWRIMHEEGLVRTKIWHRPARPRRVERMQPAAPNQAWQIDMTSLLLSDLTPLYLVMVVDCYDREIVGWTLDRRCRASEWVSALRMGLESRGLSSPQLCQGLLLRSDNGAQPCSRRFVQYLASTGVQGQYTGYNAPDDNAYVERVIRTIKEEEIWPNQYDTFTEAHLAVHQYIRWYNHGRIHSALDYRTPKEVHDQYFALKAA